jgi:hypothetical protein
MTPVNKAVTLGKKLNKETKSKGKQRKRKVKMICKRCQKKKAVFSSFLSS